MKIDFIPYGLDKSMDNPLSSLNSILTGTWEESNQIFQASNSARIAQNKKKKVGLQSDLNALITQKLIDAGWEGEEGRFFRDGSWIRISFRHYMSQGADLLEAYSVFKRENFKQIALIYGEDAFLKSVWPGGHSALCSYEKAVSMWSQYEEILPMPLILGKIHF